MKDFDEKLVNLAVRLYNCEAVKFGNYKMKIGSYSPIYFDLRVIIGYPDLMESVCELLYDLALSQSKYDQICGVPYTALPIATILSVKSKIPMVIRRKEAKAYGTKKLIEGHYKPNDKCIIIEDVVTSGSSILETVADLKNENLDVTEAIIILDREQGGVENLLRKGIKVTSLLTISKFIQILLDAELINESVFTKVEEYLKSSQINTTVSSIDVDRTKLSYSARSKLAENAVAKILYQVMCEKQTNLCLAADVKTCKEVLHLLNETGPYICLFKIHVDILEDFNNDFINELVTLAKKHKVLLMEDRKFGDIGNTVALQFSQGIYKVSSWADLITVHLLPGQGVIQGIKSVLSDRPLGVFLIAEMSSKGNLITPEYTEASMKIATEESILVAGVVCQSKNIIKSPGLIQLTPGVQITNSYDHLGQQYSSPENVILEKGADIAVVGRGIIQAADPAKEAMLYRDRLWSSYETRLK